MPTTLIRVSGRNSRLINYLKGVAHDFDVVAFLVVAINCKQFATTSIYSHKGGDGYNLTRLVVTKNLNFHHNSNYY